MGKKTTSSSNSIENFGCDSEAMTTALSEMAGQQEETRIRLKASTCF